MRIAEAVRIPTQEKTERLPSARQQKVKSEEIKKIKENNPEKFEELKNVFIFGYGKEKRTTTEAESAKQQVRQRAIGENKNEYVKTISDITRRVLENANQSSGSLLNKPGSKVNQSSAKRNEFGD